MKLFLEILNMGSQFLLYTVADCDICLVRDVGVRKEFQSTVK